MNVLEQLMTYYAQNGSYVMDEFGRHFLMSAYGVLFAAVVGVPAESSSRIFAVCQPGCLP